MMNQPNHSNHVKSERGQALVLLVLGMVVLLGFTALAIDGGMVYSDRRHAQNASDAASLAGGAAAAMYLENHYVTYMNWDNCTNSYIYYAQGEAITAAISRAGDNGYVIDNNIGDNHGVTVTCSDVWKGAWYDRYLDIRTLITADTQTAFAHFVYNGPLQNRVEAVARVRPRIPLAFGHAIVGLNPGPCSGNKAGVIFGGSSQTNVNGGGIFSNGCLGSNGSSFSAFVSNGNVSYAGEIEGSATTTNINPHPVQVTQTLPESSYAVPAPDCTGLPHRTQGGDTLEPGEYSKITMSGSDEVTLNPGLYCVTGGPNAVKITGGRLRGSGITIYVTTGDVAISGGADVRLNAPARAPDPSPAIPGMLIYLAPGNTGTVELEGNNDSEYMGTIYAPSGDLKITGTTGMYPTFNTQLIANNVFVSGNAFIDINFNGDQNYSRPTAIELNK
jgi:Flp pilus assembly protein TadG